MEYNNIIVDNLGGIFILTISRPKALNALNKMTMAEINHFFTEGYKAVKDLKGIIITGAGEKAFVAGADISEFNALSKEEGIQLAKTGQDIFTRIERFHLPVIAAVNGFALGGGCELAMACHLRYASENARFGQPEVNLGLIPGYGGTQRLIQYIGKGKAMELLMTANMINAEEALNLGLVNGVYTLDELLDQCKKVILSISKKGPIAIAKIIESVNAFFDNELDGFEVENQNFGQTIGSEDSKEGALAFLEKRSPNFKGV